MIFFGQLNGFVDALYYFSANGVHLGAELTAEYSVTNVDDVARAADASHSPLGGSRPGPGRRVKGGLKPSEQLIESVLTNLGQPSI
jgi:hypothetical protein